MNSTGRYVVRYEPSDSDHEYLQTTIEMSISDEATVDDMANFFDSFLKAATYVYDGSLKIVRNAPTKKSYEICEPVSSVTSINWGSYKDTVISGSSGTDTISFGAAQPVEWGSKSWDDVVSFG